MAAYSSQQIADAYNAAVNAGWSANQIADAMNQYQIAGSQLDQAMGWQPGATERYVQANNVTPLQTSNNIQAGGYYGDWIGSLGGQFANDPYLSPAKNALRNFQGTQDYTSMAGGQWTDQQMQTVQNMAGRFGMTADQVNQYFGWNPGTFETWANGSGQAPLTGTAMPFNLTDQLYDKQTSNGPGYVTHNGLPDIRGWVPYPTYASGGQLDAAAAQYPGILGQVAGMNIAGPVTYGGGNGVVTGGGTTGGTTTTVQGDGITPGITGYQASLGSVATYNPYTQQVEYNDLVQNQLASAMQSPYAQQARLGALESANARGLLNSSIAAQAGEAAALQAALPIAQQDASTYMQTRLQNASDINAALKWNAGETNTMTGLNLGYLNQAARDFASASNTAAIQAASNNLQVLLQQMRQQADQYSTDLQRTNYLDNVLQGLITSGLTNGVFADSNIAAGYLSMIASAFPDMGLNVIGPAANAAAALVV